LARADDHPLKGVALVIGESDYATLHKLDNPKRDARAMDDMLDSLGFSVDRVLDGDANKLRAEIADFIAEAKSADVALIYLDLSPIRWPDHQSHGLASWFVQVHSDSASPLASCQPCSVASAIACSAFSHRASARRKRTSSR